MSRIADRVGLLRTMAGRWAAGPLAVRLLLFAAGATTVALATPTQFLLTRGLPIAVVGAAVVALAPRGRMASWLLLAAAFGWLASTILFGNPVGVARLVGLSAAMYLVHTLAALAAVLPYDAVLPPGVVGGWLLRAAIVLLTSSGLGIFAMVEAPVVTESGYLLASIVGVLVVGALLWVLTRAGRAS
jgi:hypothetical protein